MSLDFLGNKFLTASGEAGAEILDGVKAVGIYFSAHWCPPCRGFTPVLAEFYKEVNASEKQLEILFVSSDKDESSMKDYHSSMGFAAIPFGDQRVQQLKQKYSVSGIPFLVILKPNGEVVTTNGRGDVTSMGPAAIENWKK